ncbi:MAG: PadR family transcriptional regulator [Acidimicrobiales bacterium]
MVIYRDYSQPIEHGGTQMRGEHQGPGEHFGMGGHHGPGPGPGWHGGPPPHLRRLFMREGGFGPPWAAKRTRRGDVRAAVLELLGERPMHGYEIIREVEERSGGRWRPSPGSIYPTLQLLEDEALVTSADQDGRRVFSLSEAGQAARAERARGGGGQVFAGQPDDAHLRLRDAAVSLHEAARAAARSGTDEQQQAVTDLLVQARRSIYRLLADDPA